MAQVTIYLPEDLEQEVRRAAKRARKTLSAYIADVTRAQVRPATWPSGFAALYGSWAGEFPDVPDARPDDVDTL
jgi:hypothetical protein